MLFERTLCRFDIETRHKFIRNFLETVILDQLANKEIPWDRLKAAIHVKFDVLLDQGTICPVLDSLVRKELIKKKKRILRETVYTRTEKGSIYLLATLDAYENIIKFLVPTPFSDNNSKTQVTSKPVIG